MPQKTKAYRPTPASPTTATPQATSDATENLDDFLEEVDAILSEEEAFAVNYRQRGGQ